jgi:hypothetical protein
MLRKLAAGIALAAAITLPLAGCGKSTGGSSAKASESPSPTPSPSPKPAEALAAAVDKTQAAGNFTFTVANGTDKSTGVYDASTKAIFLDANGDGTIKVWYFGTDIYLAGFPGTPAGKTVHVDLKKITADGSFSAVADPVAGLRLLATAATVEQPSPGTFKGTIDLTKLDANAAPGTKLFVAALTKHVKGGVTAIPFTATVNDQGRVTSFKATFPGADDGKDLDYTLTLADFGTTKTVTKPTANVVEASTSFYKILNSAG